MGFESRWNQKVAVGRVDVSQGLNAFSSDLVSFGDLTMLLEGEFLEKDFLLIDKY